MRVQFWDYLSNSCVTGYAEAVNCTGLADGSYDEGFKSYVQCTGRVREDVECDGELVFNSWTKVCDE